MLARPSARAAPTAHARPRRAHWPTNAPRPSAPGRDSAPAPTGRAARGRSSRSRARSAASRQAVTVCGGKAEEAEEAKMVLRNARRRLADEPHPVRPQIGDAADMVVHDAVARGRQRIQGEVAALGVLPPVAAEADIGVAA